MAACRSTWSEPIPAVSASLSSGARAIRSAVRYAGQNGWEITLEHRVGPVLVGGHDQPVSPLLEELPQTELARDAAEQLAGLEAEPRGRGRGLAAGVALDVGDLIARVGGRIPVHRIVVEHTK